ncbi:MAG TPA: DNA topoisomerase (ATP-hydrolyzing) subunit B [Clostridiaceae bacterium]|nr:DNA topoisomerase (ATP-hydrolyzing) subunit B [Clostridiaceae bacterium]
MDWNEDKEQSGINEEFFKDELFRDETTQADEQPVNLAKDIYALTDDNFEEDLINVDDQDTFDTSNTREYTENDIQVLEGLEAVRKRPGMYIGDTTTRGLHHLLYEIVANSIDEAIAGRCDEISIILNKDGSVSVEDDGSGIPVGVHEKMGIPTVEVVHTILHAGGKFGGGAYSVSGGLHGVGASVVNALSEWMEVYVKREGDDKVYHIEFARGQTVKPLEIISTTSVDESGTNTIFKPDPEIFPDVTFDFDRMLTRYREMAFLNKEVTIHLTDDRHDEGPINRTYHYEGGIISFVEYLNRVKKPLFDTPIYLASAVDDTFVEIAMQYNQSYDESIYSYANNIATTEGGSHLTGFRTALTRTINAYARSSNLLKENEDNFDGADVREGLCAIISVKLPEPQFEGQTKGRLGNSEMRPIVEKMVNDRLMAFLEENPQIARVIIDKCHRSMQARKASNRARELSRRRDAFDTISLPGKLADCQMDDPELNEIFIVEGDSAGGSAKGGRERRYQAILPLWGKMLNVERARKDQVYNNDKLSPIVMALGTNIGDDFDLSKLRYHKVIIMADADVDGSHIRTLLLTFFYRYMRPLVENGHVYIACPPLYKVYMNEKSFYAYDEDGIETIKDEQGWDNPNIQRYKGLGEMSPDQLWETTMNPETRRLLKVEIGDAKEASDVLSLLMGEEVEPRRTFIQENARYANLDF